MFRQWLLRLLLVGVILLVSAVPVMAGGFAIVVLDALPGRVVANEPLTIGFMVRQHGTRPMEGLSPRVIATRSDTNESFTVFAKAEGKAGHYAATLIFPTTGAWAWVINDGFNTTEAFGLPGGQPMPTLNVLAAEGSVNPASSSSTFTPVPSLPLVVSLLSLLGVGVGLFFLYRTRAAWAAAVTLTALVVGGLSVASAARPLNPAPAAPVVSLTTDEGAALFLAKGCVICHSATDIGPNLAHFSAKPDYLRKWLKDPAAVKPETQMPNLELSDAEIEALVNFLSTTDMEPSGADGVSSIEPPH